MKINSFLWKIVFILSILALIGTLYNLKLTYDYDKNNPYIHQIEDLNNKIKLEQMKIAKLKKYKTKKLLPIKKTYLDFTKELRYIIIGSPEILNYSIIMEGEGSTIDTSIKRTENPYIYELDIKTVMRINESSKEVDLSEKQINFFKIYKPIVYIYESTKNKPIVVNGIEFQKSSLKFKLKIIGKK